jgi:hypothetical protein
MNRREFFADLGIAVGALTIGAPAAVGAATVASRTYDFQTRHVVWIINGSGSRKMDWYENPALCPNFARLARESFVYEESFNDTVGNHERALSELLTGDPHAWQHPSFPTVMDYVRAAHPNRASNVWMLTDRDGEDSEPLAAVPHILKKFKPRLIVCRITAHDAAHGNHGRPRLKTGQYEYFNVCRTTDEQVGRIFDFLKADEYFSRTTALVVRPEFGRDDEPNVYGEIHHSEGFYQTHYSAEIWWGPDFKVGVDRGVKNRIDFAPSLLRLFNIDAVAAVGRVHAEMFKAAVA